MLQKQDGDRYVPNRILREGILTSDRINALDASAELFYRRLMSVVDDYGRFDARPIMLKVACFPLRVDLVREADISRWMATCQKAGLLALYDVSGKKYLELVDFNQQVRAKRSKYPSAADATQMLSTREAHAPVVGVGDVVEGERKAKAARARATPIPPDFAISERVKAWAEDKGYPELERYLECFIGRFRANGKTYIDWDETFMNAIREDWYGLREGKSGHQGSGKESRIAEQERVLAGLTGGKPGRIIDAGH